MYQLSVKIENLTKIFEKLENIKNIWEIGNIDGQNEKDLIEAFPVAKIISFEPNPDTFEILNDVSSKSLGRIRALNVASSNSDREITFYKIDTKTTFISWPDGNAGTYSLIIANDEYQIEKYSQIPIKVQSSKASTLIKINRFYVPNLIWIEVEGAEKLVLERFEEFLSSIDFLHIKLSLIRLYLGQPMAGEIIHLISKNFFWHTNLSLGTWQFDAFFVNKKFNKQSL